jgi:hypothetical protein
MNPYSTDPSQDQDGKEDAFRKATADVFESDHLVAVTPDPTVEELVKKLQDTEAAWLRDWREWRSKTQNLREELHAANRQIASMIRHDQANLESDSIVASCNCHVKTNEVLFHKPGCKYRLISERDEARKELDNLKAGTIHSCGDHCQRPNCVTRRENKAMREAIREAHIQIRYAEASFAGMAIRLHPSDPSNDAVLLRTGNALAKLKPFIS